MDKGQHRSVHHVMLLSKSFCFGIYVNTSDLDFSLLFLICVGKRARPEFLVFALSCKA